jgi:hypothetical protein
VSRGALALAIGHLGWIALLALPTPWPLEVTLAPYAVAFAALALVLTPGVRKLLRPQPSDLLWGLGSGVLLGAVTHIGAALLFRWFPAIEASVRALYVQASVDNRADLILLGLVGVVVIAEEIIWRGAVYRRLAERFPGWRAIVLASLCYTSSTLGLMNPMLVVAALMMGLAWTLLAARSGRLVAPLLSHLTWDLIVLVLYPL